jgi:hypothetical protein
MSKYSDTVVKITIGNLSKQKIKVNKEIKLILNSLL